MKTPDSSAAKVELTVPLLAEYVGIARLTAAGVANRAGFDIEAIEDIKVSLSEVCNRLIGIKGKCSRTHEVDCKIIFSITEKDLTIEFQMEKCDEFGAYMTDGVKAHGNAGAVGDVKITFNDIVTDGDCHSDDFGDRLQLSLITLLMDEFKVNPDGRSLVSMKKFLA